MKKDKKPVIGIIGGLGKMGNLFHSFFEKEGFTVFVSDKETKMTNKEVVNLSDIVFLSLPVSEIKNVISEIKPFLKKDHLLVDISSIKMKILKEFKNLDCGVLLSHPLFGPLTSRLEDQIIIFSVLKENHWVGFLNNFFKKKVKVFEISPQEHDYQMALIQALPHFLNFLLGRILFLERKKFKSYLSTPLFRLQSLILGRIFLQKPEIFFPIQAENGYFQQILTKMKKEFFSLEKILKKKNFSEFEKKFNEVSSMLEDFKKIAQLKSNEVLSLIERQPLKTFSFSKVDIKDLKVGFLGPEGTFSHEAVLSLFSRLKKDKLFPFKTMREIFEAVNNGEVNIALVPVENSITGLIGETINLLIEYPLFVSGSFVFPVCQSLLARSRSKKEIKEIQTIPQAFFQCQSWVKRNFPRAKISFANSTSEAILKRKEKSVAFIASPLAGKIYKLHILARNIQDKKENFTKFFVISPSINKELAEKLNSKKTLFFLAVYDRIGILKEILEVFSQKNINLTSLHSIPSPLKPWDYFFFLEAQIDYNSPLLQKILKELENYCALLRFLGLS